MLRAQWTIGVLALGAILCLVAWLAWSPERQPSVTLAAVGDVLLARGVGKQMERHGRDYPFDGIRGTLRQADLAFCNLECALSRRGVSHRRRFQFRADPALAGTLRRAGLTVASLANNHTLDFGRDALLDTARSIEGSGMTAVGAGRNIREALAVRVIRKSGLRIGFVAYTDVVNAGVTRLGDRPTVAGVDAGSLAGQIRAAKRQCDCLVVSFHWGVEYMKRPTRRQRTLARLSIDSGADLVLGHHPHVLQPSEIYKTRPILYSMGACVWDGKVFGADRSALYLIRLGRSSARLVRTVPVRIIDCQPRIALSKESGR